MRSPRERNFTSVVCARLSAFVFEQLRLTPKQFAEILGCDQSMVYRIRRGESLPDLAKLLDLWSHAHALGATLNFEWLITGQASLGMAELPTAGHLDALRLLQGIDGDQVQILLPLLQLLADKSVSR